MKKSQKLKQILLLLLLLTSYISCKHDSGILNLGDISAIGENGLGPDSLDLLKINEIQLVASHNSYRTKTDPSIFNFVQSIKGLLPSGLNPDGWDYEHPPFPQQLGNYKVRGLELDIYYDPNGGLFANRAGNLLVQKPVASGLAELNYPGFKMLHIPDLDYNSNYLTFKAGLIALKEWSDANPNHIPIFVNIETKEETPASVVTSAIPFPIPGLIFTEAALFDASAIKDLDEEIKSVFGINLEKVFTPDELRQNYPTLREAAMARNWPSLQSMRGHIVFIMEGDAVDNYLEGGSSLEGKASFVYSNSINKDYASFVILNNPVSDFNEIQEAVSKGFMVRTRSDSDTEEARTNDYTNANSAIASGAQIISTDYYRPDPRSAIPGSGWSDFKVALPDGKMFRINPVVAPDKFSTQQLTE